MISNSLMLATSALLVLSASAAINSEIEDPTTAIGQDLQPLQLQDLLDQANQDAKDQEDEQDGGARRLARTTVQVRCPTSFYEKKEYTRIGCTTNR